MQICWESGNDQRQSLMSYTDFQLFDTKALTKRVLGKVGKHFSWAIHSFKHLFS